MHVIRRIAVVVLFIVSWLLLLTRFGQLHFHRTLDKEEEPNTSYVNNIVRCAAQRGRASAYCAQGIVTAMLWLLPGVVMFAIVSGRVEHQEVHNLLWMTYHSILLLVCILGGSDLQGAITNVTTFDAVHIDVAFVFVATIVYALLPQTTHVVVHAHPESREPLMEEGGNEVFGIDELPAETSLSGSGQGL
jgi:hypothetical protein